MAREKRSPGGCRSASEKPQIGSRRLCRLSKSFEEGKCEVFQLWYPNSVQAIVFFFIRRLFYHQTLLFKEHC